MAAMMFLLLPLSCVAVRAQPQARVWTPEPKKLSSAITDADPFSYEFVCHVTAHDPCDFGLEWAKPRTLNEVVVDYATLNWLAYQPALDGQSLQYWNGSIWRPLHASLEVNYRNMAEFAPVSGIGTVRWTYRFTPITTTRIRVYVTRPNNPDPGFRLSTVRRFWAGEGHNDHQDEPIRIVGAPASRPEWLEPGANLAVPAARAQVIPGSRAEVRWPRRLMVNFLRVSPPANVTAVEWWDGASWRSVEILDASRRGDARFLPVATSRLRLATGQPVSSLEARLDSEASRYFREVEKSRVDMFGIRFRSNRRPDLAGMQGLLLSLDFAKASIGRPEDEHETTVMAGGTFVMTEPEEPEPRTGLALKHDRWFAFALGSENHLVGRDWMRVDRRYAAGGLPAVVTTYTYKGLHFEQRLHVTVPGEEPYGNVTEVVLSNRSGAPIQTALTLVMGRQRNSWGPTNKSTPFFLDPGPTGYKLASDRQTVLSQAGDIIVYAETPGEWGGTPRENHLRYSLSLAPGKSRVLRFFVPNVGEKIRDVETLRKFQWTNSFPNFRTWWEKLLASGMTVELPEPGLNKIYKNLIAQALVIALDGEKARYGAYQYEYYFGIEEGWPAVALAEWGHPATAQKIASYMLSPEVMDKRSGHHQYRNGLSAFYATNIFRLTRDRAWLQQIAPSLETNADWTIKTINENKDPKYGGILPRYQYGGDISTPAYSFYSSATCWRGLNDTALVFGQIGRMEKALRYREEADRFRRRLWEVADLVADRRHQPVFLPMAFEIGQHPNYREREPTYGFVGLNTPKSNTWEYLGNYWNLFAPMLQEVKLFETEDARANWIPDYMDARGGVLAGLVRFLLGVDHVYGKGYYESLLELGRRDEFLTSFYGIFAHGMSQNLYSSPEVAGVFPLRVNNPALWREYQRTLWQWWFMWDYGYDGWQNYEGEPLSAGAGVALHILRMALVRETGKSSVQDTLRLLDGAPRHWFEPGKKLAVRNAPTFFGSVSLETEAEKGIIRARVSRSSGFGARHTILRLPSPSGATLRSVTIDGKPWHEFSGNDIQLPAGEHIDVVADFGSS